MNTLFDEFSASSATAWKERLAKDLKGITFEDLSIQDRNGLNIHPFYTELDASKAIFSHSNWDICAEIVLHKDAAIANKKALEELQNGVSALVFFVDANDDLTELLKDIQLQHIYTRFVISGDVPLFIQHWQTYLASQNLEANKLHCSLIADSIHHYLSHDISFDISKSQADFALLLHTQQQIAIDASIYQNAGANSSTQLACTLSQLNEYLHWASLSDTLSIVKTVNIGITTGTDFFEEIAKMRALKLLVLTILEEYQISAHINIHVQTSDTYRSPFDAYSNLLRDTIAGMAAVLGGCHSLCIHKFDENIKSDSAFSSRMSRNQQLIMKEESYLHHIADAASGSFYLENLTQQLSEKAWTMFKVIEQKGGLIAYYESNALKASIEQQAQEWIEAYKSGKKVLIGVNKFVNAADEVKASTTAQQKAKALNPILLHEVIL